MFDSVKPYKGGNDILWQLHRLNNIDKHRTIFATAVGYSVDVVPDMLSTMGEEIHEKFRGLEGVSAFIKPANPVPIVVGSVLFDAGQDSSDNPNMKFKFEINLHEVGIVEEEGINFLSAMANEVEKQIALFSPHY